MPANARRGSDTVSGSAGCVGAGSAVWQPAASPSWPCECAAGNSACGSKGGCSPSVPGVSGCFGCCCSIGAGTKTSSKRIDCRAHLCAKIRQPGAQRRFGRTRPDEEDLKIHGGWNASGKFRTRRAVCFPKQAPHPVTLHSRTNVPSYNEPGADCSRAGFINNILEHDVASAKAIALAENPAEGVVTTKPRRAWQFGSIDPAHRHERQQCVSSTPALLLRVARLVAYGKAPPALCAATCKNLATVLAGHALAESVLVAALTAAGLVCTLHESAG